MKRIIFLFSLVTVGILSNGCSAEQLIGSMTANIDGVTWTATAPGGTIQNGRIVITGIGQSKNISLTLNGTTAQTGTFPIDVLNQTNFLTYLPNISSPQGILTAVSGSITVTSASSNRMSGTFNVVVSNGSTNTTIANGQFNNIIYL